MSKEEFKGFVRNNPKLISYVKNGEMTWQKFYEMYDLYGENNEIWNNYLTREEVAASTVNTISGFSDVVNWFKNVDLNSLQEGINNVQRVIGVVQDFGKSNNTTIESNTYKPRPLYKHFED